MVLQRKGTTKKDFVSMIEALPEKELRQFVVEYGKNNPDFKDLLQAYFTAQDETGGKDGGKNIYTKMIKAAAKKSAGRGRFFDYYNAGNLVREIDQLLAQANSAIGMQHYAVAADIAFAVVENVHEALKNSDDSGGGMGGCVSAGFGILMQLTGEDIPYDLRARIFNDAIKEAKSPKYDFVGFDDNWLQVVIAAAYDQEKKAKAMGLIDTLLAAASKKEVEWTQEYDTQRLVKHKLALLRKLDLNKDAVKLRQQFLYLPDIRKDLIEECIVKKEYAEARRLIGEGVKIADGKNNPSTTLAFKKILLEIAIEERDVVDVRKVARELYDKGRHPEFYKVIKDSYRDEEWPTIVEMLIEEIKLEHTAIRGIRFNDDDRLAFIFTEERDWDRLLLLVQGSVSLHFVDQYATRLKERFPTEMLLVYRAVLVEYAAQHASRNHYVIIRQRLKKMMAWEGGRDAVKELIGQFMGQYKVRTAMMEELRKVMG